MIVSYDAYRVFYTVARFGSFTKAASVLLASQPNLTRTIRNLESALGCTLFVRSNRGVSLTPEGEKLFARVSVACEQIQAGEEELASDRSLQSGVVSIGASETALHGFLLPVLGAFHRAYPGIRLRISNHSTPPGACCAEKRFGGCGRRHLAHGGYERPAHRAAGAI